MADYKDFPIRVSDQALEMVMQDVLDGMLELTLDVAFNESHPGFELVEICPVDAAKDSGDCQNRGRQTYPNGAEILPFPRLRKMAG